MILNDIKTDGVVTEEQLHKLKQKPVEEPDFNKVDNYLLEPLNDLYNECLNVYSSQSGVEKLLRKFKKELFAIYSVNNNGNKPQRTPVAGGYWLKYVGQEEGFTEAEQLLLARSFEAVDSFNVTKAGQYLWKNVKTYHDETLKAQLFLLRKALHQISMNQEKIWMCRSEHIHSFRDLKFIIEHKIKLRAENHNTNHDPNKFLQQQQFNKRLRQVGSDLDMIATMAEIYREIFEQH